MRHLRVERANNAIFPGQRAGARGLAGGNDGAGQLAGAGKAVPERATPKNFSAGASEGAPRAGPHAPGVTGANVWGNNDRGPDERLWESCDQITKRPRHGWRRGPGGHLSQFLRCRLIPLREHHTASQIMGNDCGSTATRAGPTGAMPRREARVSRCLAASTACAVRCCARTPCAASGRGTSVRDAESWWRRRRADPGRKAGCVACWCCCRCEPASLSRSGRIRSGLRCRRRGQTAARPPAGRRSAG